MSTRVSRKLWRIFNTLVQATLMILCLSVLWYVRLLLCLPVCLFVCLSVCLSVIQMAVWPPGYRLLLRLCTKETPKDKTPQPLATILAREAAASGVALLLSGQDGSGCRSTGRKPMQPVGGVRWLGNTPKRWCSRLYGKDRPCPSKGVLETSWR